MKEFNLVKVCITYRMSSNWECAENCLCTSILEQDLEEMIHEIEYNCWSMSMECTAGKRVTEMLTALAKLQGYRKVDNWSIRKDEKK